MKLIRITDSSQLLSNDAIYQLLSLSINSPTFGRVKTAAESLYSKEQGKFYTAVDDDGKIVGIIGAKRIDNERLELKHIAVDESLRKQGIAKRMMMDIVREEGVPMMTAEVDHKFQTFFLKCGFKTKTIVDEAMDTEFCMCTYWAHN